MTQDQVMKLFRSFLGIMQDPRTVMATAIAVNPENIAYLYAVLRDDTDPKGTLFTVAYRPDNRHPDYWVPATPWTAPKECSGEKKSG